MENNKKKALIFIFKIMVGNLENRYFLNMVNIINIEF